MRVRVRKSTPPLLSFRAPHSISSLALSTPWPRPTATTSELAKWADRLTVACCVCLDARFLWGAARQQPHRHVVIQPPLLRHEVHLGDVTEMMPAAAAAVASGSDGVVAACGLALLAAVGLFAAAKAFEHRCHRKRWVEVES